MTPLSSPEVPPPVPPVRRAPLPRRLLRLLPVRVRHYWRLLAVCAAFLAVVTVVFGTERVRPYVTSASDAAGSGTTVNITGDRDLFDATVAHTVSLTFRDADYQRMLDGFFNDNEKEFIEADLTVDGTLVPSVGIRLKGNSTLMGMTRNGKARQRGPGAGGRQGGNPPGGAPPEGARLDGAPPQDTQQNGAAPQGPQQEGAAPGGGPMGGGRVGGGFMGSTMSAEKPEGLPWLISFDEFVKGRRYQGHQEVAVRAPGFGATTGANEALALELLAATGDATQQYAFGSFKVNNRPTTLRLLVENPDENFAERIDGSGVLYKALSTSQFSDQGEDPVEYQDDYKQINMKGSQDLQPVIDLVRWANSASDAEFDARLADHVDVESFARYCAMQNLMLNFDDMSGPGRNYFLRYDLDSHRFTVIAWDHNLAFTGDAAQGPHESSGFGGRPAGGGFPGVPADAGAQPPTAAQPTPGQGTTGQSTTGKSTTGKSTTGKSTTGKSTTGQSTTGQSTTGKSTGTQRDPGTEQGRVWGPRAGQDGGAMGRAGGMGNRLKDRFLASKAFTKVYENAYRTLYQRLFASGTALEKLSGITAVLSTVEGADRDAVTGETGKLRTLLEQRTAALANDTVVKGG